MASHYEAGGGGVRTSLRWRQFASSTDDLVASFDGTGPRATQTGRSRRTPGTSVTAAPALAPRRANVRRERHLHVQLTVTDNEGATNSVTHPSDRGAEPVSDRGLHFG